MPHADESSTSRGIALLLRAIGSPPGVVTDRDVTDADWPTLLLLARWHRCLPLLSHALEPVAGVPDDVRTALRRASVVAAARSARVEQVLLATQRILSAADVPFLLLKGPAIAHAAYALPDLRPYDDLDLLLQPDDIVRAARALLAAGYRPLTPMRDAGIRRQVLAGWDYGMQDPTGMTLVELCTGVAPRFFAAPADAALRARAGTVTVAGAAIPAPCARDLLQLLALHGAKHMWSRLIWVADTAGLLARHNAGSLVGDALREARRTGCERMLRLALELAGHAAPAPPPSPREDRAVRRLAYQVRARWNAHVMTEPHGAGELRFHLRVRERRRDRLRHLVLLGLTPSHGDRQWLPLPDRLHPLHYALRPLRLAITALRSILRSSTPSTL